MKIETPKRPPPGVVSRLAAAGWIASAMSLGVLVSGVSGCGVLGPANDSRRSESDSTLLAVVGDRNITRGDLESRLLDRYWGKRALLGLVREALFEQEAERLSIPVSDAEVEAAVDADLASGGLDELLAGLAEVGLSLEDVRQELRVEVRNALLTQRVVKAERRIGEEQIQDYYQRTFAVDRVEARHIAFPFEASGEPTDVQIAETLQRAASTRSQLLAGGDFGALAQQLSGYAETGQRGGRMGIVSRESVRDPSIVELLFSLPPGDVSQPYREGDYGFHLFRVDRVLATQPLNAVREQLRRELQERAPTLQEIATVERLLRQRLLVTVFQDNLIRSDDRRKKPPRDLP